jgi:hypothetical protein
MTFVWTKDPKYNAETTEVLTLAEECSGDAMSTDAEQLVRKACNGCIECLGANCLFAWLQRGRELPTMKKKKKQHE